MNDETKMSVQLVVYEGLLDIAEKGQDAQRKEAQKYKALYFQCLQHLDNLLLLNRGIEDYPFVRNATAWRESLFPTAKL